MHIRWSRYSLLTLTTLMLCGALAAVVWVFTGLSNPQPASITTMAINPTGELAPSSNLPPLERFTHIWQANIRDSLTQAARTDVPQVKEVPPQSFPAKLVAIALDQEWPSAIFLDGAGQLNALTLGQQIEGMTITRIDHQTVKLEEGARQVELKVPERYGMWP